MVFNIFYLFFIFCFSTFSVSAVSSTNKRNGQQYYTILIKHGDLNYLEKSIQMVKNTRSLKLYKIIKDDDPNSFDAFIVTGDEAEVLSTFHDRDYLVSRYIPVKAQSIKSIKSKIISDWGLRRISNSRYMYKYPKSAGKGVIVYVVDSGVTKDHKHFKGRVEDAKDWQQITFTKTETYQFNHRIHNAHGSKIAGIIGAKKFGVAPKVTIVSINVVPPFSTDIDPGMVLQAYQYILSDMRQHGRPTVINIAHGYQGKDEARAYALEQLYRAGAHIVTAAGNSGINACEVFPGRLPFVLNVAASDINNELWEDSNYGQCIDIVAPGVNITSINPWGGISLVTGTSIAAPFVSGVLALLLSERKFQSVRHAYLYVINIAKRGVLKKLRGPTPNLLLFNGISNFCIGKYCKLK